MFTPKEGASDSQSDNEPENDNNSENVCVTLDFSESKGNVTVSPDITGSAMNETVHLSNLLESVKSEDIYSDDSAQRKSIGKALDPDPAEGKVS
jgi:hypothetical protein